MVSKGTLWNVKRQEARCCKARILNSEVRIDRRQSDQERGWRNRFDEEKVGGWSV